MRILLIVTLFFSTLFATAQSNRLALVSPINKTVDVKLVILDEENAMEPLAFATVIIKEKAQEITTNLKGEVITKLKPGAYNFEIQFVGYETKVLRNIIVVSGKSIELKTSLQSLQLEPSVDFDVFFSEKTEN